MASRNIIEIIVKSITGQARNDLKGFTRGAEQDLTTLRTVGRAAMGLIAGYVGHQTLSMISNLADWAAKNMEVADSFEALAARYNLSATAIVDALKRASKGTVAETDLILQANKAMRLGVATTVGEFEQLMKIAYVRAKEFGLSVAEAWEYIVTGVGRASPMILDNIGILMDAERTFTDYANSIGKAKDELTIYEKKQAIVNSILADGADDLERWADMADTAGDKTAKLTAKTIEAKQAFGEVAAVIKGELSVAILEAAESADLLIRILEGVGKGTVEATKVTQDYRGWLGRAALATEDVTDMQRAYRNAMAESTGVTAEMGRRWGEFHQESKRAIEASQQLGDAQQDLADDTDEAAKAAERAADTWHDYTTDVADANWRFTRRMEDSLFRQSQAAEDSAFRRYEIERDASQRLGDLWNRYRLDEYYDTRRHNMDLHWMRKDLLDELSDMEWEHQQEKRDMLEQSPWWIRQALQGEFAERERVAASGDKKALKQFDAALLERIRAIDPVYAKELERLQEHYEHERTIEKREGSKDQRRRQQDYRLDQREQLAHLNLQERQLRRELADQMEAWRFHGQQRIENERWAMDRLRQEHAHQLSVMERDLNHRLSEINRDFAHWGWTHGTSYSTKLQEALTRGAFISAPDISAALTRGAFISAQHGTDYVPRTMPAILHRGEAVLPAPQAERYRRGEGGISVNIESMNVAGGSAGARQFVRQIEEELGRGIRQRSR